MAQRLNKIARIARLRSNFPPEKWMQDRKENAGFHVEDGPINSNAGHEYEGSGTGTRISKLVEGVLLVTCSSSWSRDHRSDDEASEEEQKL